MLFFILLSLVLLAVCLYLYIDNNKLKDKVNKLELENKTILERKIISSKEDLVSIDNISIKKNEEVLSEKNKSTLIDKNLRNESPVEFMDWSKNRLDQKYVARVNDEIIVPNIPKPTSSVLTSDIQKLDSHDRNIKVNQERKMEQVKSITKDSLNFEDNRVVSMEVDFDPNEFIKMDTKLTPEVDEVKHYKNDEYLRDIAKKLESEIAPQTVDLTDYEKDQEENAIISYKELLSLKEQSNNQVKNDKSFLEDLRALRNLLDQNT